jgi:hypothetical protein
LHDRRDGLLGDEHAGHPRKVEGGLVADALSPLLAMQEVRRRRDHEEAPEDHRDAGPDPPSRLRIALAEVADQPSYEATIAQLADSCGLFSGHCAVP